MLLHLGWVLLSWFFKFCLIRPTPPTLIFLFLFLICQPLSASLILLILTPPSSASSSSPTLCSCLPSSSSSSSSSLTPVVQLVAGATAPAALPAHHGWAPLLIQALWQHREHHGWWRGPLLSPHAPTLPQSQVSNSSTHEINQQLQLPKSTILFLKARFQSRFTGATPGWSCYCFYRTFLHCSVKAKMSERCLVWIGS